MFLGAVLCSFCIHAVAPAAAQDFGESYLQFAEKPKKPHILLVLADDLGYGDVGWTRKESGAESQEVQTPALDQLVSEGVELTRFYVYAFCSPTRSALQTGRFPIHVNTENADPTIYNQSDSSGIGAGIPRNMTGMAQKLQKAGYRTHMVGKWDAGMATPTHTPKGRGYDTALCYFHHANDEWDQKTGDACGVAVDLYDTSGPAYGLNSSQHVDHYNISAYEEYIFQERALSVIEKHDPSEPLFLFYSSHLAHLPYEVPQQYLDKMSPFIDNTTSQGNVRLTYHAMVNFLDGVVGNITAAFKAKGLWEDTLMLFFSDNGGPIYVGGNNYPLRGGKYSDFEGGVRVAAFASGGLLPQKFHGTKQGGIASVADVYSTVCGLAGTDHVDHIAAAAGLPPVDGMDLSSMLLTGSPSPRQEVPLSPLKSADLGKFSMYFNDSSWSRKQKCWKVESCDLADRDLMVKTTKEMDCCTLCNSTQDCAASVWYAGSKPQGDGTCHLKKTGTEQSVVDDGSKKTCFFPGNQGMPTPIVTTASGIVMGDMKLILGLVKEVAWTGPHFPNASTPWTPPSEMKTPSFRCSLPRKIGCLFNVTADPTEHNDLALTQHAALLRLLHRLRNVSTTVFDPMRGKLDPKACDQVRKNKGFFGPWLEMEEAAEMDGNKWDTELFTI